MRQLILRCQLGKAIMVTRNALGLIGFLQGHGPFRWFLIAAFVLAVQSAIPTGTATAQVGRDGPFGIYMGMPSYLLEQISEPDENGWIDVQSVPVPHPDFSRYQILATRTRGICGIMASTGAMKDERQADELETRIIRQIEARYSDYGYKKVIEPIEETIEDGTKTTFSKIEWSQMEEPHRRREGVTIITYFRWDRSDTNIGSNFIIRFDFDNAWGCYESRRDQSNPF